MISGPDALTKTGAGILTLSGGNTYISIDGGKTTIELQGVTSLTSSDVTPKH